MNRKLPWTIVAALLLLLATLGLVLVLSGLQARRGAAHPLPVLGMINDFTLTNQAGGAVTLANLRGHPWVADIIFTRCAGPCLRMSRQMRELQDALPASSDAKLVTLTTDADYDTPAVLAGYGQRRFGANTNRWIFLTGTRRQIADVATDNLKLSAVPKPAAERESDADLFVHSTIFVVIDKQARLRGIFQTGGEGVDWASEKLKILAALRQLGRES